MSRRDVGRLQRECAALGHGVGGVHDHVHDDLFELARVRLHGFQSGSGNDADIHAPAHQQPDGVFHAGEDGVQIEDLWPEELFASERQELAGQGRRALGRLVDLGGVFGAADFRGQSAEQQFTLSRGWPSGCC